MDCPATPVPAAPGLENRDADVVLIVDDAPENLAVLHDALDETGYAVRVATNGETALDSASRHKPDIILLDAIMPGLDGFEVCRRLKAAPLTGSVPVIFMTGLLESEHVVAAFAAGGTDYITKPMRVREVLARVAAHLANSRQTRQARQALDAFGQAVVAISAADGRPVWETPLARALLDSYFPADGRQLPATVAKWLAVVQKTGLRGGKTMPLMVQQGARRLIFSLFDSAAEGELMLLMREESDAAQVDALLRNFNLTQREAEVLYWLTKGKTNRDIGDILGSSPRTVNKHLEHVFVKLGVETRTSAAAMAMQQVRVLRPAN